MADDWIKLHCVIPAELAGQRLDQALASLYREHSRSRISDWIKRGEVLVNESLARPRDRLAGGEQIRIDARIEADTGPQPEAIAFDIIHEDADILIVNKPAGLVVHPGAGNPRHTLLNALLHHAPQLAAIPRAGIVQRLDKDTSGLMVIAKTLTAHTGLVEALQERRIKREYLAVVNGVLTAGGRIDQAIGRHPRQRLRMAVTPDGKPAVTHFRVVERYRAHTLIRVQLETGRTHQIRVHMAWQNQPILGDPLYGSRPKLPAGTSEPVRATIQGFKRQALHACTLALQQPATGEEQQFEAPLPADMRELCEQLATDRNTHG